jgi:hypothetical protein
MKGLFTRNRKNRTDDTTCRPTQNCYRPTQNCCHQTQNCCRLTQNCCRLTQNCCCPTEFCTNFLFRVNTPLGFVRWRLLTTQFGMKCCLGSNVISIFLFFL